MGAEPSASTSNTLECVCFTLIVDDIVFPDGRTAMGVLGGGGKATAAEWAEGSLSTSHSHQMQRFIVYILYVNGRTAMGALGGGGR